MQKETEDKYTFIAEYKKGTYISQCIAANILKAVKAWVLENSKNFLNEKEYDKLKNMYDNEIYLPIKILEVENVWCCSYTINRNLMILNIIKTA